MPGAPRAFDLRRRLMLLAGVALLLFILDAWLAASGRTAAFDRSVLAGLRVAGAPAQADFPRWLLRLAILSAPFGTWPIRLGLALIGGLILLARDRAREAVTLISITLAAALLLPLLKALFDRARPDLVWRLVAAPDPSFPSGHALGAATLYPLLGFIIGRALGGLAGARWGVALGWAVALIIGGARVLLGVHWTSDVIGGWLLGAALSFASLALVVRRRDAIGGGVIGDWTGAPIGRLSSARGSDPRSG